MALPDIFPGKFVVPGTFTRVQPGGPQGIGPQSHRALIMGIRLSTGTVPALTPVQVTNAEQGAAFHGEGSQLAAMVRAFKRNNPLVEVWTVGIAEDGGGTAATKTITVTGTATEAGTINLYVHGVRVAVAVAVDDGQNAIAAAIEAAIDAVTKLHVTAGVADNVVTTTVRWKGASGTDIDIRHSYYPGEKLPAGVALAIAAVTPGATDPDLADIVAVLDADVGYDTVVVPFIDTANLTVIEDELASRAGSIKGIPGQAFVAKRDTYSNTQTLGDGRNSEFLTILGTSLTPTTPWEVAAAVAAIDAGFSPLNAPRRGIDVLGVLPPAEGARFDLTERNLLLQDGVSTFTVVAGRYQIERLVTTRQTTNGVDDASYFDIGTARVLNYIRRDIREWSTLYYKGSVLADDEDDIAPGVKAAKPKTIKGDVGGRLRLYGQAAMIGKIASTEETMVVEKNGGIPGRADLSMTLNVIQGFHLFAVDITFTI